ncbi:MAG: HVO_2523 family zinc finger protein [Rubrobacteraceae bacterium]
MNTRDAEKTPEPASSVENEDEYPIQACEVCGTKMYGLHCKIVCPNCGYKRDCSDP